MRENTQIESGVYRVGWIIAVVLVTAIPYGLCFFGLDFTDTPYHLNNAHHYMQFPSVVLSYFGLAMLERLTGFGILGSRMVTVFLYQAVSGLALLLAWKYKAQICTLHKKIRFHPLACSWVVVNLILVCRGYHIAGYDAGSNYLLVLTFCFMLVYQSTGRSVWLLGAGTTSALSVLARLPNVCVVLVVFAWIVGRSLIHREFFRKLFLSLLFYIVPFVLIISLSLVFLYGSVGEGIEVYGRGFSSANASYGLITLLKKYLIHGLLSLRWLGVVHLISSAFREFESKGRSVWWYLGLALIALGGCSLLTILPGGNVPTELVLFLNACLIYWVGQWLYQAYDGHLVAPDSLLLAVGVLCFAFLPVAGSNTGLIKVFSLLYIPWVIVMRFDAFAKSDRWVLGTLLALLTVNALFLRFQTQYEDFPIHKTRSIVAQPLLRGIRTAEDRKNFIESADRQVIASKSDFIFVGHLRHLFNYLYDKDDTYSSQFWGELDSSIYIDEVERHLIANDISTVFLVPDYPEVVEGNRPNTPMDEMLSKRGYRLIVGSDKYRLYRKE